MKIPARGFVHLTELADSGKFPTDRNGRNVLHHLCAWHDPDTNRIDQYVEGGCDYLERNPKEENASPFAFAIAYRHPKVIDIFLKDISQRHHIPSLHQIFEVLNNEVDTSDPPFHITPDQLRQAQNIVDYLTDIITNKNTGQAPLPSDFWN